MEQKEDSRVDFAKMFQPLAFDKPEVVEEINRIQKETNLIFKSAKIDPFKMLTIFYKA